MGAVVVIQSTGRQRARVFISGRVALKDLVLYQEQFRKSNKKVLTLLARSLTGEFEMTIFYSKMHHCQNGRFKFLRLNRPL
jgi:hypothetical protein